MFVPSRLSCFDEQSTYVEQLSGIWMTNFSGGASSFFDKHSKVVPEVILLLKGSKQRQAIGARLEGLKISIPNPGNIHVSPTGPKFLLTFVALVRFTGYSFGLLEKLRRTIIIAVSP